MFLRHHVSGMQRGRGSAIPLKVMANGCNSSCLFLHKFFTVDFCGLREVDRSCGVSSRCFLKTAAADTVTVFFGGLMRFGVFNASRWRSCIAEFMHLPSMARMDKCQGAVYGAVWCGEVRLRRGMFKLFRTVRQARHHKGKSVRYRA